MTAAIASPLAAVDPVVVALSVEDPADERRLLGALVPAGGFSVVRGPAPDAGEEARWEADVVVLWSRSAAHEVAATIRRIREGDDAVRMVAVLAEEDSGNLRRALRAGADGLLFESQIAGSLALTVAGVAQGFISVPRSLRSNIVRQPLSYREKQVLGMVVMGLTNRQIADRLYLAESTVKTHVSSSLSKLNARSRAEAAALILDPEEGLGAGILQLTERERAKA